MSVLAKTKLDRIDRILPRVTSHTFVKLADLEIEAWTTPEPVSFDDRRTGMHRRLKVGDSWGEIWDCAWFHFTGTVPAEAAGKNVVLLIDLNGEGLVVDSAGEPVQCLTCVSSCFDLSLGKPGKRVVPLVDKAKGGEKVDLWVDAGLNDLFGLLQNGGRVEEARIAIQQNDVLALCYDIEVLRELLNQLPAESARYASLLQALYEASLILSPGVISDAVSAARSILKRELDKRGGDPSLTISAIGHAHIDLAWLWPIRETIRKGARTFSNVLRLMDRYPDFRFGASQPQLYQWMKDRYPTLYSQIKERVKQGRWEVQGAMWVEPDANIPSGESLARQILYGKRFFRQEFGKDVTNLWMPDVFGYPGSLPGIMKRAGVETFLTQKLSWSLFNQHPNHTFNWVGIDGSEVLVHMPPEATYNSSAAPRAIARAEREYLDKTVSDRCLLLFGIGDGGGGPGEEHLERLAREKNLAGLAPVVQEATRDFFDRLAKDRERYATWHGELYLERHQGTLTTQARTKRFNRKLEFAMAGLESAAVRALMVGHPYPSEKIERIWKEALLYQFHDILPGSSIARVYAESHARYETMHAEIEDLTADAERAFLGEGSQTAIANSLGHTRREWVKHNGAWYWVDIGPFAYVPLPEPHRDFSEISAGKSAIENELIRLELDANGEVASIRIKESGRELVRPGQIGNRLAVYDEDGDAWDMAPDYESVPPSQFELVKAEAFLDGPEAIVRHTRSYGESRLVQEIVLTSGSRRIDFRTKIDWKERGKMLRTSFPLAIHADSATCDIPFGSIQRPTHVNTSWDWAKSEICAQKWVDLSEPTFGAALLNDCKYGHRVNSGRLDLNLLRSPLYPDNQADYGTHEFTYSLLPHTGSLVNGGVVEAALELNVPLRVVDSVARPEQPAFVWIDHPGLTVGTVKKAEDGDAIIVRAYNALGSSSRSVMRFGFPVKSVAKVDLMEENPEPVETIDDSISIDTTPFDILTLRVDWR